MTGVARPVIWSIAGTDSGGGAGLSADQRAAEAFGLHLCPVVAAVTAQNSVAVTRVQPVAPELLDAQLAALAEDLPPLAIKTGLLGGPEQVAVVARWVDRLRARSPLALVVDPVLGASTGADFASAETLAAYRAELLPRTTLITPNRAEAARLLGLPAAEARDLPALARELLRAGTEAVCITGGDSTDHDGLALDWMASAEAAGWLALPRVPTEHSHGTGCTFASSAAAALALGFVPADALVLAKMATTLALRRGYAAGQGRGPVAAATGFASDPALLPGLSWDEAPDFSRWQPSAAESAAPDLGLYAIVDSAARLAQALQAGVRTVQLRIKTPIQPDAAWRALLSEEIRASVAAAQAHGARLFVNDHWRLARELGAAAVHLGQEDLQALGPAGREELRASGLQLGISSHSLWELARARTLAPSYVACGPVWPTLTKAMPWRAQGLDNLAWWCAMAGVPVVAIGGILSAEQMTLAARSGASGVCAVRVLGDDPSATVPTLQQALAAGRADAQTLPLPALPHPSLASKYGMVGCRPGDQLE
ncbi:bifunctional hydroxymethylpyrimidine kinase/phosphomethylpyrimidine kinase [Ramlibacter sp. 2FC]|uniref:bifunctional hydroxymethylpyrimidine kinase/phosphomethylpyrimidine kinase n=1 Tax=Ramlibacter sp. 2FC TaxID=2502188 RepID=UPI0010F8D904|nr:bifunctional hydroxymethylpyrimidine kinase/phosphomethylpyrimidine kinase [Ramlibacter sp. 2FC]